KATFKMMVEVAVKAVEKKAREDRGELRRREDQAEKKRDTAKRDDDRKAERRIREEERRAERQEREEERRERDRKEAERRERETQKALAAIVKLPSVEHEPALKKLAKRLDTDIEVLRVEFDELLGDEPDKIRRGIVAQLTPRAYIIVEPTGPA